MYIRKFIVFGMVLALVMLFSQRSAISRDGKLVVTMKPRCYLVSTSSIIDFDVEIKAKNADLSTISILPESESGLASVYDSENDTWIGQNSSWTSAPEINDHLKVKVIGISSSTQLKFLIQNRLDGKIYETEEITIYGRSTLDGYTNKINANLSTFEIDRNEAEEANKESAKDAANEIIPNPQSVSASGMPKKYLIMYAAIFLASAGAGFTTHKFKSKYSKMT